MRKDYMTRLGASETDRDLVGRLAARYTRGDLFAEELLHRNEHSIEFQALFLAWALGTEGYKIVPILVGSFHEMIVNGTTPVSDERVGGVIAALKDELKGANPRVLIMAGVRVLPPRRQMCRRCLDPR